MNSTKVKVSFLLLCMAWLCCGCQQAPQEVLERMDSYGENKQMASKERDYCTIAELKRTKMSDSDVKTDNIILPQDVDFSEIESISILNLSFVENYMENREEAIDLFGIDENSLINDTFDAETNMGGTAIYDSPVDRKYLAVEDNGFVSFVSGLTYDYINDKAEYGATLKKYDLEAEGLSGKKVEFEEREVDIAAARESAETWLNENIPMKDCEYRISDAYVRELSCSGEKKRQLSFYAEVFYRGMQFNSYASKQHADNAQVDFYMYGIQLNYDGWEQLSFFSNGVGKINIDSGKEINEVIDLKSAIQLMNEEMSGFRELNITKILPMYVLYPTYQTDEELYAVPGQKMEGRPVYAFLIAEGSDDTEFGINKSNAYKVIFVDMVTGEVTTNIG